MTMLLPALIADRFVPDGLKVHEREYWHRDSLIKYAIFTEDGSHIIDCRSLDQVMACLKMYKALDDLGMVCNGRMVE